MLRFIIGAFVVLHGLVHLLYSAQSWRFFQLQPGLLWPEGSWAFSRLLGEEGARWLAAVSCTLAALSFVVGGAAIFAGQSWWRPVVVGSAVLSAAIFLLFWDGGLSRLSDKGAIAILINIVILVAVLVFGWPAFEF
jgi:hypothetical protein